jgi:hypothetical protein
VKDKWTFKTKRSDDQRPDPAAEASGVSTELASLSRVCCVLGALRSTTHYLLARLRLVINGQIGDQPLPAGMIGNNQLVELIHAVIMRLPFFREGGAHVSGKGRAGAAALRRAATPAAGAPAPRQATVRGLDQCHGAEPAMGDQRPCGPNRRRRTLGSGSSTWSTAGRHSALEAAIVSGLEDATTWIFQYRSHHFTGSAVRLGISDSPAFSGGPECNGLRRPLDHGPERRPAAAA